MDLRKKQRLFPYTALIDWFYTETESVYCAVRAELLYLILVTFGL